MSDRERRETRGFQGKTPIEQDMERTITDLILGNETKEPIRIGKKIIKSPDSETTIEYELSVDPSSGKQEVIEHITTNKKECAKCSRYTTQLRECDYCHMNLCNACMTTIFVGHWEHKTCKSCYDGLAKTLFKT